jgi:hypothetical protein
MNGWDKGFRDFALIFAYSFIPLGSLLDCINQPKALVAGKGNQAIIATRIRVKRMARLMDEIQEVCWREKLNFQGDVGIDPWAYCPSMHCKFIRLYIS